MQPPSESDPIDPGTGITVLIVEHNMKVVMEVCTKLAVLDFGIKIAEGTPGAIARDE
jgi:branched-chain amino acid transport system ATP-binding protein